MANYSVDIEVALKGVEKLRQFERLIESSVNNLDELNKQLKKVQQQNPYDVSGARRLTEADKIRLNIIKETNRVLSEQERIQRRISAEGAKERLAADVARRKAATPEVKRRFVPVTGPNVMYPQGAGPGEGPTAAANRQMARDLQAAAARKNVYAIKQATRFLEIQLINKEIQLEVDGMELIGQKMRENNKQWMRDWDARFKARQEEKNEALRIAKIEADAATKQLRQQKQLAEARSKRIKDAASSAIIGGAFPLLFGQGIGAAAGGAAGGGLGGLAGGQLGFALSLVGTTLGSVFDQLANKAKETAKSLKDPITNFEAIKSATLLASGAQERYVETLIKTGQFTKANAIIQQEILSKIGTQGVRDLQNLDAANAKFSRALNELGLQISGFVAGPLAAFLSAVSSRLQLFTEANRAAAESQSFLERLSPAKQQEYRNRSIQLANQLGMASGEERDRRLAALRSEFEKYAAPVPAKQLSPEAQKELNIYKGTTAEMQKQAQLAQARLALTSQNLSLNKQGYAAAASAVNTLEYELQKLAIKNQMLREGYDAERNQALHRQAALQYQAQQTALAEQVRQQNIADSQAYLGLLVRANEVLLEKVDIEQQTADLTLTDEASIERKLEDLKKQHNLQSAILDNQHLSVRQSDEFLKNAELIGRTQASEKQNLETKQKLETQIVMRQREQLQLSKLRTQQERELQLFQMTSEYTTRLMQTGIQSQFFGPFGGSAQLQQQSALEFEFGLRARELEIAQQTAQLGKTTDPKEIQQIEERRAQLEKSLAVYEQYEMRVNAAAVEQARFNEALQFTQPVIDGVFESLIAVAEGTKSAQEAFADFLRGIANMLIDTVKVMIAQYIALGVARMFAGVPAGGEARTAAGDRAFMERTAGLDLAGSLYKRANGGPVSAGTPYLVGERGPEMFVPRTSGSIYPNDAMGGGGVQVGSINISVENKGEQLSPEAQKRLANQVQGIVMATLVNQKRSGGML